ncbi:MAG: trypsin-like peptidase domain-containing protein [Polyangiaceae bacterium]
MGGGIELARRVVKAVALLVGAATTLVCGMALLGRFTENAWLRAGGVLLAMVVVPALIADRALPKGDANPGRSRGLPSDVFALAWLGVPVLVAVVFGSATRSALLVEARRSAAAGNAWLARLSLALAGEPPSFDSVSAAPSASASASAPLPAASASASAAPPSSSAPTPEVQPKKAAAGDSTPAELFKRLAPAVVTISLMDADGDETGGGTGFLIDRAGTTVTNHHVVEHGRKLRVKFIDGASYEDITLLVDDAANDLALLRLTLDKPKSGKAPTFEPLKLGDSDAVVVGERAISIGNPLGLDHTLTDGLVSARRVIEGRPWIQMSVPVSPGNSGGPLFNMRGDVIGVTTAQLGFFVRGQNLNLAVPVNVLAHHVQANYPGARPFGQSAPSSHW